MSSVFNRTFGSITYHCKQSPEEHDLSLNFCYFYIHCTKQIPFSFAYIPFKFGNKIDKSRMNYLISIAEIFL